MAPAAIGMSGRPRLKASRRRVSSVAGLASSPSPGSDMSSPGSWPNGRLPSNPVSGRSMNMGLGLGSAPGRPAR